MRVKLFRLNPRKGKGNFLKLITQAKNEHERILDKHPFEDGVAFYHHYVFILYFPSIITAFRFISDWDLILQLEIKYTSV